LSAPWQRGTVFREDDYLCWLALDSIFIPRSSESLVRHVLRKEKKRGKKPWTIEHQMENRRDAKALIAAPIAVAGLLCLLIFFLA
jgi:hypothetical protein